MHEKVSGRKFKRTSIVAAKLGDKILAPFQYDGNMDSKMFEFWFEKYLLPTLPENTTIVMDNASFHRKSKLDFLAQKFNKKLIFLPPYSPELNPIENVWACLKRFIRKVIASCNSLDDAISIFF